MRNFFIFFIIAISGCCSVIDNKHIGFLPEKLPPAVAGEAFYATIYTNGFPVTWMSFVNDGVYLNEYIEDGLKIKLISPREDNSESRGIIEISGIPLALKSFDINIVGSTVGTQCPGLQFSKTYRISVIKSGDNSTELSYRDFDNGKVMTKCLGFFI